MMKLFSARTSARLGFLVAFAVMAFGMASTSHAAFNLAAGYGDIATNTCNNTTACVATFPTAVPAGKVLVVTSVTCNVQTSGNTSITHLAFAANNLSATTGGFLTPSTIAYFGTTGYYQSADTLFTFVKAGAKPVVGAIFTQKTNSVVTCTLGGTLK
jgi:hypothetical protein